MCAVVPLTVQLPAALKPTVRFDVDVAPRAKSASPNVLSASAAKVIVWFALPMVNVVEPVIPPKLALSKLVPTPMACASPPAATVATVGVAEDQLAVAVRSVVVRS